ncbi:MAG: hypothetical protein HY540_06215 [Deltaproteobacteria bacterium]|nr:hypothetical protein [Deltaproteobacteria bacterium]
MLLKYFLFFMFMLLASASPLCASEFEAHSTVLGQSRESSGSQHVLPFNGYVGFSGKHEKWEGTTDMRFFRDFPRKEQDYDLYQALVRFRPLELLSMDIGRQFVALESSAETIDGVRMTLFPQEHLALDVYSGMPRSVEIGDFNEDDGLLTGMSLGLIKTKRTRARIFSSWRKNKFRLNDFPHNDEIFVGGNLSYQFPIKMMPLLYGVMEYNAAAKNIDTATAGFDLYPHRRISVNAEFSFADENSEADKKTVFSLFSQDAAYFASTAVTFELIPDYVDISPRYSFSRLKPSAEGWSNGHQLNVAVPVSFADLGLHLTPSYYFLQSWGGNVHGARLDVRETWQKWFGETSFDFSTHRKVTNDHDRSWSLIGWVGYTLLKEWELAAGMEYNRNNHFNNDVRASFRMSYNFGMKT